MNIVETEEYGLANTIDGIIYIHPLLNDFPELRQKVIKHEREHQTTKGFWNQRKIDALTELSFKELLPVYKKKPSLFLKQYLPISYINGTVLIEWTLLFLYVMYLGLGYLIFWLIKTFSVNSQAFWRISGYVVVGLLISYFAYLGMKELIKYTNEQAKKLPEGKKNQLESLKQLGS